jgi:fucose permease
VNQRNYFLVVLVFVVFFVISFITNILGPLVPDIIAGFSLSLALASFLPFSFFLAYGVMSIPAGMVLERRGEKPVLVGAFVLAFAGSMLFAAIPSYSIALTSLFTIGIGMTLLQVAINPLLRVSGGEENFAFFSVMAQLIFGSASFMSPYVYSYLVANLKEYQGGGTWLLEVLHRLVPAELPWVSLYWVFATVTVAMVILLALVRLPKVELTDEERPGAWETHFRLFRKRAVWLYFIGIFAYVGSEQGVANWISKFLQTYHGLDPQTQGARVVSHFWGLMTVGCLLGLVLLRLFDSRRVLIAFAVAAMASLAAALFGPATVSAIGFRLVGFFLSVMWSIVFSLALNSLEAHHGTFSGILCTGIIGGAVVPMLVGQIGNVLGLRVGLLLVFGTLGFILSIGFWARPLINNKTVRVEEVVRAVPRAFRRFRSQSSA